MPKKLLIFSLAYFPHLVGGAEIAVKEITDRISTNEMEFDMITLYAGKSRYERIGNINVYRVGPHIQIIGNSVPKISYIIKFQYVISAFFKAIFLQHKRKYDLIWSIMASFNGFSALFFKTFYKKIPFLLTLQEGDSLEHIKKSLGIMYPLYLKIFEKANRIQVISNFLADFGKKMGAKCPISVIPNGVNINLFKEKPSTGQMKALIHELGLSPFDTILITTSRLVAKNAIGDIIDSLVYLNDNIKLLIIGTGPQEKLLKDKTKLLKLENRVRFVGFVPNKEIPIYLHISNIFIRPSLSEGFGISFVEAFAAEIPVIATPVGGILDFLEDGKTGVFCKVNNPKSIADSVEKILNNEQLRINIIKSAKDIVKQRYDWDIIANDMKDEIFASLGTKC